MLNKTVSVKEEFLATAIVVLSKREFLKVAEEKEKE